MAVQCCKLLDTLGVLVRVLGSMNRMNKIDIAKHSKAQ